MATADRPLAEQARESFLETLRTVHADCLVPCELKQETQAWIQAVMALLFPHFRTSTTPPANRLESLVDEIDHRLRHVLCGSHVPQSQHQTISEGFWRALPGVRNDLMEDARAIDEFDPASESVDEVILAYPGFYATAVYRIAHVLLTLGVPLVPRLLTEFAHGATGIDIHPGAEIGVPLVIDHGTGVVIGQSAVLGKRVKIYQGVTLGALSVRKSLAKTKRHPTIEDDVVIYAGATILGGDTVVGQGSVIGGNAWVTESVPPNTIVSSHPPLEKRDQ